MRSPRCRYQSLYTPSFLTLTTGRSRMAVPVVRRAPGGAVAASEPDPLQQALISLVIRGMARGAPDEATAALAAQGLAMVKGPITMPTPEGTAAVAALLRLEGGSPQAQDLDKLFDGFLPINRRR